MPPTFRFQPRVEPVAGPLAELALPELAARLWPFVRGPLALLDGWPAGAGLLAFGALPARPPRTLRGLRRFLARLRPEAGDPVPGAFRGGFIGALAYELGVAAERGLVLPPDPWAFPPVVGGLFTDFLVRSASGETFLVLGEAPGDGRAGVRERAQQLAREVARAARPSPCRPAGPLQRLVPPAEHARRVLRAKELIGAGEIYQANLSHRFVRDVGGDPLELHARLCRLHPAPHAGFLRWRGGAVLSASPELLLELDRDAQGWLARTRPIKGTSERGRDAREDRASAAHLLASEKDRSELAMIVDLERNDLGRVARPGSVRVEGFPTLQSFSSVHHLVADVLARPRAGIDAVAVLAALFPGGSVTGAPKLRSMEVIAELEGEGRGFAYGSLCALDLDGRCWANLLIRTLLWRPLAVQAGAGQVTFRVGGGITWGSDPQAEEAETEAKGLHLARALEGPGPPGGASPASGVWRRGGANVLL